MDRQISYRQIDRWIDRWIDRQIDPHRDLWSPERVRLGNGFHTVEFSSWISFFFFVQFSVPLLNPPHGSHQPIEPQPPRVQVVFVIFKKQQQLPSEMQHVPLGANLHRKLVFQNHAPHPHRKQNFDFFNFHDINISKQIEFVLFLSPSGIAFSSVTCPHLSLKVPPAKPF